MIELGTHKEIKNLREVWPHEAHDFTPWLAKNIVILTVGIDILIDETEDYDTNWVEKRIYADFYAL